MRMRILVAGRNAKALATTAGAFADDLVIETAATIADCIALLERTEFHMIVACETLRDGSGLEVLSHAAVNTPDTLRIFAAKPSTLEALKGELGLFGLFRTLSYPINFRKLWAALDLARGCMEQKPEPEAEQEPVVLQVRGPSPGVRAPRPASAGATVQGAQGAPSVGATVARTGAGANGRSAAASGVGGVAGNGRTTALNDGGAAANGGTSAVVRGGGAAANGGTSAAVRAGGAAANGKTSVVSRAVGATADGKTDAVSRAVGAAADGKTGSVSRAGRAATDGRTTAASGVGAAARTGAAVNGSASAQIANPSQRVQARLAAMVSAGAVAPAPKAAVRTVPARSTAASGSDAGARAAAAAAERTGAAANEAWAADADATANGAWAADADAAANEAWAAQADAAANEAWAPHADAASPSPQQQPRQGVPARATPTAAQREAHMALARAGASVAASGGTVARGATAAAVSPTITKGASAASARTGAVVNNGRAAQVAGPSRQVPSRQDVQARTTPAKQASARVPVANTSQQVQPRKVAAPQDTRASRRAAAAAQRNAQIPQTEAFKRALAKRNASKLESNADMSAVDVLGAARQSNETGNRGERRREPRIANDSLAQLARLTLTGRPTYDSRGKPRGKKRAAFFVGSGVFAAAAAAVLTFFMLNENNSMARPSRLPLVASMERPSQKVFPWQPAPQQPTGTMPLRTEASASAAADFEVQAEEASDASAVEPGHPPPPPPNPPPPPSEPPGWVDE